jgi:hypothetical protein
LHFLGETLVGESISHGERNVGVPELQVTLISDGLGFGEGTISREALEREVGDDPFEKAKSAIISQDILVPVGEIAGETIEDDGCGDGRRVGRVYKGTEPKEHSLDRYKVFGGGVAMTGAARIGLGQSDGLTLEQNFVIGMDQMDHHEVDYGAHTADHVASDNDSGCGAIDKAPAAVAYVAAHRETIKAAVASINGNTEGLDVVLDKFVRYAREVAGQLYSGRAVIDEVIRRGKVVKELTGEHKEGDLVYNTVEGFTVNQAVVREATGGKLDAFAVDEPRLREIADKQYNEAGEIDDTDYSAEDMMRMALLSEQVYTMAVSAVLTKGDQRIFLVQAAAAVPAEASR